MAMVSIIVCAIAFQQGDGSINTPLFKIYLTLVTGLVTITPFSFIYLRLEDNSRMARFFTAYLGTSLGSWTPPF
ncbi:uncharacterized protein B0H64DRAFT_57187 [Chaetomium fimeti]|uniref:Uncharacterized protein n=1 Tax=Chaetomium fimeti TaxID=1854472 RepID=A0AAE0LM92_9PEZI|nr:hypothetical protein B0H64DRAFT_57187 [Chaetomium fimeti]